MIVQLFRFIRDQAVEEIRALVQKQSPLTRDDVLRVVESTLKARHSEATSHNLLPHFRDADEKRIGSDYWNDIVKAKKQIFQKLPLPPEADVMLEEIVAASFCREWLPFGTSSGLVFAGYGEKQIFPSICAIRFSQVLDGQIKHSTVEERNISPTESAAIIPFAQQEMASVFMEGVDPDLRRLLEEYLKKIFDAYPEALLNLIPNLDASVRGNLLSTLKKVGEELHKKFVEDTKRYRNDNYIRPVIGAVAFLSKDMLAEVAESLVSLTSFKRRISITSAETVGGPLDVAVISKGDGFIWIKRKHYFRPELNHHFLSTYFGEADGKTKKSNKVPAMAAG